MNALVQFKETELALIRKTVAKDCQPHEFDMFIHIARHVGLDPLRRQIYAFVFGKGKEDEDRQLTVVTAIDGYRTISERSGNYRPDNKRPRYTYDEALKSPTNPLGIESCEVSVFKFSHGDWHEVPGFVYWGEFVPTGFRKEDVEWKEGTRKDGSTYRFKAVKENAEPVVDPSKTGWVKMPRNQIAKCAEAQAHRKAFPNDFAGVLVEEEVHRRMSEDLTASEAADAAEQEERLARIGGPNMLIVDWMDGKNLASVPAGELFGKAMDFLKSCEGEPNTIRAFRERNRETLRQYWGIKGDEALKLKEAMEAAEAQKPHPTNRPISNSIWQRGEGMSEQKKCETCRYWSELCAQSIGCGTMQALCLSDDSPNRQRMTYEHERCDRWADNHYGSIDDPSGRWRLYESEEAFEE